MERRSALITLAGAVAGLVSLPGWASGWSAETTRPTRTLLSSAQSDLLADIVDRFIYLKKGLAIILAFVGVKMLLPDVSLWLTGVSVKIPTYISLAVILSILAISVIASLIVTANRPAKLEIDEHGVHVKE